MAPPQGAPGGQATLPQQLSLPPRPSHPKDSRHQPPRRVPVPGQCPPEIHLLNPWVQAEEVGQQEGAPLGQSRLAQPEKERGGALGEQVGAEQDQRTGWRGREGMWGWRVSQATGKEAGTQEGRTGAQGQADLRLSSSSLIGCVSRDKSLNLPEPPFP